MFIDDIVRLQMHIL